MPSLVDKYHAPWMVRSMRSRARSLRMVARTRARLCGTLERQVTTRMNMQSFPRGLRAWQKLVMGKKANISCRLHSTTVIMHTCIRARGQRDHWLVVARRQLYNTGIRMKMETTGMDSGTLQEHNYARSCIRP